MLVLLSMVIMLLGGCGQSGVDNSNNTTSDVSNTDKGVSEQVISVGGRQSDHQQWQ